MTSEFSFPCWIIGLMSGTSADGVDAALLYTDGQTIATPGASLFVPYDQNVREEILAAIQSPEADHSVIAATLTEVHRQAVEQLIATGGVDRAAIKLLGFHGQTILHRPADKLTLQIGDAVDLARRTGIPVMHDFRSADVAAGGQGAPLVPLYHAARTALLEKPVMVVNIGGVANVTWIGDAVPASTAMTDLPYSMLAFDCGPGNALIDDWVHRHTGARCDEGGQFAARGTVDQAALEHFLADPYFAQPAPKSLDRQHFHTLGMALVEHASLEDGAATLSAMTAAAIAEAVRAVPHPPTRLLICGGGRHNPILMRMLQAYQLPVQAVEEVGLNGDMMEAEAFAYLAARAVLGLPLSLPTTTGVAEPLSGGRLCQPEEHHHHDDEDNDHTTPRSCCR